MRTAAELLAARCSPLAGQPALGAVQVVAQLAELPGWRLVDGAIGRTFRFASYLQTIAFVNALAWMAQREDHHPDLLVGYDSCEVHFRTHTVGGISENDFICAAKADAIFEQRYGGSTA
jgi:4a-hydroxytetrahydrobiopterin dehydratase